MNFDEIFKRAKQARGHNFDKKHVASETVESRKPLSDAGDNDDNEGSEVSCPECGHTFRIDYAPDPETAETGNDDDAETGEDAADWENSRKASLAKELGRQAARLQPRH